MEFKVFNVIGLTYEDAIFLLQQEGYEVEVRITGLNLKRQFIGKSRVLRQRVVNERKVELVIGFESYHDPSLG